MYKGLTILSVLMGTSLLGCSFEQAGQEESGQGVDPSVETVGSVSSAVNTQPRDVEPAAAVLRGVRTTANGLPIAYKDLYVFICDNHQIKLRTKGLFGWNIGGWQAIAPDYPCDTAPTVGLLTNTESNKQDVLGVYWRSDVSLIEAWYNKDGSVAVTNLLDYDPGHVPAIAGSPMVSDTSSPTKLQVVVRRYANDQVWTIAWTGSAYASLPVKRSDGSIVTTTSRFFHTFYNAGYGRDYITVEDNFNHVVFTRPPASWSTPYTQWATTNSDVNGILSIGGKSLANHGACQTGAAMRIAPGGIPQASCLDAGGALTQWEQFGPTFTYGTIYAAPSTETNWLYGHDGQILLYSADPLTYRGALPWPVGGASSAVIQVKGGEGYVFWVNTVNQAWHLMMADYTKVGDPTQATVTDLGGNVVYF